jgi:HK97 family phage prohead protease
MPYFITDESPDCPDWAVVKEDGERLGCHDSKEGAINQMIAASLAEDIPTGGEYEGTFNRSSTLRALPDNYRPATSEDVPEGRACGNCIFFNEEKLDEEGRAYCEKWEEYVEGGNYCNAWEPREEESGFAEYVREAYKDGEPDERISVRQVNLEPPAYMRAAARRGLEYLREGKGGAGLTEKTKREARAMAEGNVTADKWVRIRAWIARHLGDLRSPNADPSAPAYPSPGVVAHLLWGSGPSIRAAERALKYAEGVVARLEEENKGRARGKLVSALEIRINNADWELRETATGMTFEGYAAVFNSPSHPLSGSPRGGNFIERIAPGAFLRSLKARNDIKLLWNHDTSDVLGSTRAGTLKLVEDGRGLKVTASLPNTTAGRDAAELLKRGDVDAMSFGFTVPRDGDDWSADGTERTLREVMLHEVSIVAFPAYQETAGTATVRGLAKVALRAQVDLDALSDALLKLENGEEMTEEETKLLMDVLDSISPEDSDEPEEIIEEEVEEVVEPEPEPAAPEGDLAMLQLKKKKLELLLKGI